MMGELNIHNVSDYIKKYDLKNFIETGTGIGTGLSFAAQNSFKNLYSIEIMKELFVENYEKFECDDRITLLNNDSIKGLELIIENQMDDSPCLFWLDAHFPGADFGIGNYEDNYEAKIKIPLEEELKLIAEKRDGNDVLIIDDLRIYEDNNYQSKVNKTVLNIRKEFDINGIGFIEDLFGDTHTFKRDLRHQGFLILEPK